MNKKSFSGQFILISVLFLMTCNLATAQEETPAGPIDPYATAQTRILYENLEKLRHDHIIFGHQDALAYGVKWRDEPSRSDVKDVTGSYPALYGWDLGHIEVGADRNLDLVPFDDIRQWIIEAYERGGIITLSWHLNHPVKGNEVPEEHVPEEWEAEGSSWDTEPVIEDILPGGSHEDVFKEWLDKLANYLNNLKPDNGDSEPIPVIFRPWHEVTGHWFWWGSEAATPEQYIELWRYTVDSLQERGVNHLLYAYTPHSLNEVDDWDEYWKWYPGDDYVDIIGFDDYHTLQGDYGDEDPVGTFTEMLTWLVEHAEERGKIPVIGETGLEALYLEDWYTNYMLEAIKGDPAAQRIAYMLVWRNANEETDREDHFYAPYEGHPSAPYFLEFVNDDLILLEDDLPNLYDDESNN